MDKHDRIEKLFEHLQMKLDNCENILDELEDEGETVTPIRELIGKLWNEIDNII